MKKWVKSLILPNGVRVRRIRGGIACGIRMEIDLQHQLQRFLGLDERELLVHFKNYLPKIRSFVDVGAADGLYCLSFARAGTERVLAFEPGDEVRNRLLRNAFENGIAIGQNFQVNASFVGDGAAMVGLATVLVSLPRPVLVKVDIEGGEVSALRTSEGLPSMEGIHWIVETHSIELERECLKWFENHEYDTTIVDAAWWRMFIPEFRVGHNRWIVANRTSSPNKSVAS